jgi:hypothetical protein
VTAFITLGRIFDQNSRHNLNLLLKMVERSLPTLNREALRERKEQVVTAEQAAAYVLDKHAMTIEDVRSVRAEVKYSAIMPVTVRLTVDSRFVHCAIFAAWPKPAANLVSKDFGAWSAGPFTVPNQVDCRSE